MLPPAPRPPPVLTPLPLLHSADPAPPHAGLAHLHEQNVAHRDIKCANVLLTEAGPAGQHQGQGQGHSKPAGAEVPSTWPHRCQVV